MTSKDIASMIFTFTVIGIVIGLSVFTARHITYGYLPLDGVSGDKVFNESGYVLQYCREHASVSPNPVQDLVDKGIITWGWFDGETCMTVKQFHDAYLGKYPINGQVQEETKAKVTVDQGDIRQFLELGEERYRELCLKSGVLDDTTKDLLDYMPKDMEKELTEGLRKDRCENKISQIKNQTLGSIIEDEK